MDVDPIVCPLVAAGTDGERRKRGAPRAKQQFSTPDFEDGDPVSHAEGGSAGRGWDWRFGVHSPRSPPPRERKRPRRVFRGRQPPKLVNI